jgi:Family of unknown function (DUF6328)
VESDESIRLNRELIEFLNELRVVLPGVTVLFGFLLAVPFYVAFNTATTLQRNVYFVAFLSSAAASAFLITPSLYHRLHWRRDVHDKEAMMLTFNRLVLVGGLLLALSMTCAIFLVTDRLFDTAYAAGVGGASALLFSSLWFLLPLSRKQRDRNRF